jgi:hypothetical protein
MILLLRAIKGPGEEFLSTAHPRPRLLRDKNQMASDKNRIRNNLHLNPIVMLLVEDERKRGGP